MKSVSRALMGIGAALALGAAAPLPAMPAAAVPPPRPAIANPSGVQAPVSAHALTHDDVEAFLDGFFPEALTRSNVAGAVVVVVKDGHVLFEKGYGYSDLDTRAPVDPKRTLFRPGSISKLFTWTAVMQLVEQHKLDLDRDVNDYLDFRIPATYAKPITLRDLMTHTAGFEEQIKGLMQHDPKRLLPLRAVLIGDLPARIFPPGEVSAYSNYGASLAGYIVQRVSGEKFENYVEHHIFAPLRMEHSTFEQPLPKNLASDMSKGYMSSQEKAKPFELINLAPAGGLSAAGDDMAQFMMAQLNDGFYNGVRILKPETAKLMHAPAWQPSPPLPAMALGFYHEDTNGHVVIGHGGDLELFHSDLHLVTDANVGFYVSLNSAGKNEGLLAGTRPLLFEAFMDRYFPGPALTPAKAIASAKQDGEKVAGYYEMSRRSETNFMRVGTLAGPVRVIAAKDGSLSVPGFDGPDGPQKLIEVAPFIWRDTHTKHRLVAVMDGGHVKWVSTDLFPAILVLQPVPFLLSPGFQLPLLFGSFAMLLLTALFWPVKAMLRWRYARPFEFTGRDAMLYRLTRVTALVDVVLIGGWMAFLLLGEQNLSLLDTPGDIYIRLLQLLAVLAIIGAVVAFLEFVTAIRDGGRPWWTKLTDGLVALSALAIVWFIFAYHFISLSLKY